MSGLEERPQPTAVPILGDQGRSKEAGPAVSSARTRPVTGDAFRIPQRAASSDSGTVDARTIRRTDVGSRIGAALSWSARLTSAALDDDFLCRSALGYRRPEARDNDRCHAPSADPPFHDAPVTTAIFHS
jgi:hypothetical protein